MGLGGPGVQALRIGEQVLQNLHQGGGVITGHDGGGLLVAGQLCLIPAGWAHEFRVLRHSRLSLLYSPQPACTTFSQLQVSPMLAGLFARLPELGEGETRDAYLRVLRHELGLAAPLAGQLPLAVDLDPRLLRVLERLCQAPSVKVTLEALARQAALSPFHFHRLFKSVTGMTPKAWQQAWRARRLREALGQGEKVTDAALAAGFPDSSSYYQQADAALGMTGRQFRRGGGDIDITWVCGDGPLGRCLVAESGRGVCAVLPGEDDALLYAELASLFPNARLHPGDDAFRQRVAQVFSHLDDHRQPFSLPLDLRGTAFQLQVWQALRQMVFLEGAYLRGESRQTYEHLLETMGESELFASLSSHKSSESE